MNAATMTNDKAGRMSTVLGTAMMIAWTLVIGIGGVALLLTVAFGLFSNNLNLAVVSSFLLFVPLLLTIVWGVTLAASILDEKSAAATIFIPAVREGYFEQRARISYVPNYL
jgi:predicted ABC-type exoprotein transport system permease subunit